MMNKVPSVTLKMLRSDIIPIDTGSSLIGTWPDPLQEQWDRDLRFLKSQLEEDNSRIKQELEEVTANFNSYKSRAQTGESRCGPVLYVLASICASSTSYPFQVAPAAPFDFPFASGLPLVNRLQYMMVPVRVRS
jgi:hypothetical protein